MIQSTETARVTIRLTGQPSRSKMAGPCWIRIGTDHRSATYAAETERVVEAPKGSTIIAQAKVVLRRASKPRGEEDRAEWSLVVTGDPADTVRLSLGSPQSVDAVLTGVVRS
jgi:hypothetical protein